MNASTHDVALIGAGFTGAALAIQLARTLPAGARIALIGSPHETGRGLAYRTEKPEHLLNVRAERMSLFADDPAHFVRWLERQGLSGESGDGYVARHSYGRYVGETLNAAIGDTRQRVRVEVVEGTAVDVERVDGIFSIRLASGDQYRTPAAVLCTGNGRSDFPLREASIADAARDFMIRQPFIDYRMGTIAGDARILFVGTGLTMIDQVLSLDRAGHTGPMVAVSRHGFLPAAHLRQRTEPRAFDRPPGDLTLARLFASVVEAARSEVARGSDWRAVIDGLRPQTQALWQSLPAADQRRFFRHLESFWSVHRHRMAPVAAERVTALIAEGRLTVLAGRVVGVRKTGSGVTAALRARGSRTIELQPFDWIVNCAGHGSGPAADPLVARVLARGLARADRNGRGLDVGADARLVDRGGKPVPGFYAAGPLTAGRFLEITAVPDIRVQVAEMAHVLAGFLADAGKPPTLLRHGLRR